MFILDKNVIDDENLSIFAEKNIKLFDIVILLKSIDIYHERFWSLDYSRGEVAVTARKRPMKL